MTAILQTLDYPDPTQFSPLDYSYEAALAVKGARLVAGVDEVGRGPWAGPVVAGAFCRLDGEGIVEGVNDSKKLSKARREDIYENLINVNRVFGVGIVEVNEIDELGIAVAVRLAMQRAVMALPMEADVIVADGRNVRDFVDTQTLKFDKADGLVYSVGAAAIIAKVTRDRIMDSYAKEYPEYGFDSHVGYGTAKHRDALIAHGVLPIHRRSYKPIKALLGEV